MKVRLVCPACAWRYAGVVNPSCDRCLGEGLLAANVPEGVDPWVAARAVTLDGVNNNREKKVAVGLLATDLAGAVGLPESTLVKGTAGRSNIGRAAGKLLRSMEVRPPPAPRKKTKRRTKAEIAADRAAVDASLAAVQKVRAERMAQMKALRLEEEAAAATLEAFRVRHPDEYAEVYESERTMASIGDLPAVGVRSYTANAVVARRAFP